MSINITPLSGVDLTKPLDQKTVKEINDAWMEYLVIVFRDQIISDDDHARLCQYFGSLGTLKRPDNLKTETMKSAAYPITYVSNVMEFYQMVK